MAWCRGSIFPSSSCTPWWRNGYVAFPPLPSIPPTHPTTPPHSPQCIITAGEPYLKALAKAEAEGIALPNTVEHLRASASAFLLKATTEKKKEEDLPFSFWGAADPSLNAPPVAEYYLPSKYLPAFWPLFALGAVATLHALVLLLQVWLVDFKCWVRYRKVDSGTSFSHPPTYPPTHPLYLPCLV